MFGDVILADEPGWSKATSMQRILDFSSLGVLLHGEIELGWQGFVLAMVGVLGVVLLFDYLALRAIRSIRRHRRLSFAERLMKRRSHIVVELRRFLSRVRR